MTVRHQATRRRRAPGWAGVLSGGLLVLALAASVVAALVPAPSRPTAGAATAVIQSRVIGRSVLNRPIIAYRLGDPSSPVKVIILGQMHGDEPAGVTVANSIIAQRQAVTGIDLWVIPTMNPDGAARHTRQNIHGVDLNRNWPDRWARLTGEFYSGPAPLSEPETKAMYAFLKLIKPRYLVSLHQPLNGVDTTDGGAREPALSRTLARSLGLPQKAFNCNSECLGSMTGWMTRYQKGSGITIEFGAAPSRAYLTGQARLGILSAVRGRLASLSSRNPHAHIDRAAARGSTVTFAGWVFEPDNRAATVAVTLYDGARLISTSPVRPRRADVNRVYGLTGIHGFSFTFGARDGSHVYCAVFVNSGAGTGNSRLCQRVNVTGNPTGHLDAASVTGADPASARVSVAGWAFDPDVPSTSIAIRVTVDGVVAVSVPAARPRPDVNRIRKVTGNHGFAVTLPPSTTATWTVGSPHRVCVIVPNVGPATGVSGSLGCRDLAISA